MKSSTILAPEGRARLRAWLDRSRLTQAEAAATIGILPSRFCEYLTGERRPTLDAAIQIEDATGIPPRVWRRTEGPTGDSYVNQSPITGARSRRLESVNSNRADQTQTLRQLRGSTKIPPMGTERALS